MLRILFEQQKCLAQLSAWYA